MQCLHGSASIGIATPSSDNMPTNDISIGLRDTQSSRRSPRVLAIPLVVSKAMTVEATWEEMVVRRPMGRR
jgi:hypothetical protein